MLLKGLFQKIGITRSVGFNLASQIWSLLTGPLTLIVIAGYMTKQQQGYYYTFSSVLALQVFAELGLSTVLVQSASHEWAFLSLDSSRRIAGREINFMRLSGLLRVGIRWYSIAGLVAALGIGLGGGAFFSSGSTFDIAWQGPWAALSCLTAFALLSMPFTSLIEGCNQVEAIYGYRFVAGLLSTSSLLISIYLKVGLYSLAISSAVRFLVTIAFLLIWYRQFIFQLIVEGKPGKWIGWKTEIWPFQWRIAVSWLSGYFIFSIFNPVMFKYHGAVIAGQMGMSLTLANAVNSISYAWAQSRAPELGILIAKKNYQTLDNRFSKILLLQVIIAVLACFALIVGVEVVSKLGLDLRSRILPLQLLGMLMIVSVTNSVTNGMALYLRAHKKEPMMLISLISGVLIGGSVWFFGAKFGPQGAVYSYFVLALVWGLPSTIVVFTRFKRRWHNDAINGAEL